MKKALLALAFLSLNSFAGSTGSLWCAMSPYGTPTEVAQNAAWAYRYVQIDKMSDLEIQVDVEDLYYNKGEVFKVTLASQKGAEISGIALGKYVGKRNVTVSVEGGRILVQDDTVTLKCEIPGDYQTDYSSYVR